MSWYHSTLVNNDRRSSRLIASCKRFSRRLSTGLYRAVSRRQTSDTHPDFLSSNLQNPKTLDDMIKCTRFSKSEIRLLYRSFKQECPGGNVSEERLRSIYLQFFPQGNANRYIHYLFLTMDRNRKGAFSFDDYILTLSTLCRGTLEEKLRWIFRLYDINNDGRLTRENVADLILSFYELLGMPNSMGNGQNDAKKHADQIFERIDPYNPEFITIEDFLDFCKQRTYLLDSIQELSCCL